MTEYDYSPHAMEQFNAKMRGISAWARETSLATTQTSTLHSTSPTSYVPRSGHIPSPPPSRSRPPPPTDRRHSSHHHRSRSIGEPDRRVRSNSISVRPHPQRSRTYSYATQPLPASTPMYPAGNGVVQARRGHTIPMYAPGTQPQVITYDPTKPFVYNAYPGARIEVQPYNQTYNFRPPMPMAQPRQAPLLKRLFTSLAWRPSSRPSSAHQENVRTPHYAHTPTHSRAKSRDTGRGRDREHDRRRHRRNSVA